MPADSLLHLCRAKTRLAVEESGGLRGNNIFRQEVVIPHPCYPPVTSAQHFSEVVVTENGKKYTGVPGLGPADDLVMLQGDGRRNTIAKSDIDDLFPGKVSMVPEGLLDNLVLQEMSNLFAFLDELPTLSVSTGRGPDNGKLL